MSKRTGPSNPQLNKLIEMLEKGYFEFKSPIWREISEKLTKPSRQKVQVNLSEINENAPDGGAVVVPGVVLGDGELTKTVSIAAWRFSASAMEKIKKTKSKPLTIEELMKINPKGTGVRILV